MNQGDQINQRMIDSDLIDVGTLDFCDDQTWLYILPEDTGEPVDIIDWSITCDWPVVEDEEYLNRENKLGDILDAIIKDEIQSMPDKHKFDSRTYVRPKRRLQRPSLQTMVEHVNQSPKKYLTYNKYTDKESISPMLRLKTFNVDANTDNSVAVKEYALKRRSLVQDDDPQLEDTDLNLVSDGSARLSNDPVPSKPIVIDYSQPAHNIHSTFNKGMSSLNDRGSLSMFRSGDSLMRMSPPSLVSSVNMENSGNYNMESLESRKSINLHRESAGIANARDSIDPMMTSMTLSILDDKEMSTSFLSQSTYTDHDSLMDCMPPSLVSSVNSSFVVSNMAQSKTDTEPNVFSSATFTQLEQSERLLSGRPRCPMFNTSSYTKRDIRNSTSYTKAKEESAQVDHLTNSHKERKSDMSETITLHYANTKYGRTIEKEHYDSTFKTDNAFYKDMGLVKGEENERNSLNVTLNKQELNEIIQARQKLSLARKALPNDADKVTNSQESPTQTIHLPNQTIKVPKQNIENVNDILSRRSAFGGYGFDKKEDQPKEVPTRESPKRNATFKKMSPKASMDATMVFTRDDNKVIDIHSALSDLVDTNDRTLKHTDWGSQDRAMVGSNESTDTGTFSSSSPPESVPDHTTVEPCQIVSTPLTVLKNSQRNDLLNLSNISPIYKMLDDKSFVVTPNDQNSTNNSTLALSRTVVNSATVLKNSQRNDLLNLSNISPIYNMLDDKSDVVTPNDQNRIANNGTLALSRTVVNSATMVKKPAVKRDVLTGNQSPEKNVFGAAGLRSPPKPAATSASCGSMAPPVNVPRKTGLPTSKLRQYSSHRELSRIPGAPTSMTAVRTAAPRGSAMLRRNVFGSNPALSPSQHSVPPPCRREDYVQHTDEKPEEAAKPTIPTPVLVRQGTETLRRDRPLSQLQAPKDLRATASPLHLTPSRTSYYGLQPPSTVRPNSTSVTLLRNSRSTSAPAPKFTGVPASEARPCSGVEQRGSALPRPSRLPAPRKGIRPPSVYSVAPTADVDRY